MQDKYYRFGELTEEEDEMVTIENKGFRPMEFDNLHQFGVVYEMNLDYMVY